VSENKNKSSISSRQRMPAAGESMMSNKRGGTLFARCLLAAIVLALPAALPAQDLGSAKVKDGFTFAAGGDLFNRTPLSKLNHPELNKMLKLLQDADATFANHESSAFDLPGPGSITYAAQNGGGYPRFSNALERDFKAMGIDLVSMANNHAGDWGQDGLLATLATVDAAGLVQAGAGASLSEARKPGIFYSPRGTVALIATASTFNPATVAFDGTGAIKPRPGISVLRARPVIELTEAQMELMRRVSAAWWNPNSGVREDAPGAVTVGGATYRAGTSGKLTYLVDKDDRDAIVSSITSAKRANDLVAFSIHAHEVATAGSRASAADFLPDLFHQAIDAGADIVIRHGPHILGGVEIYKGKPIFYSLSSLFFTFGTPETASDPAYRQRTGFFDNAVSVTEFKNGKPSVVRIYPLITLIEPGPAFGGSKIAIGEDARRILTTMERESAQWGTRIPIENDVGVIRLAP
jgi:poly-gamma-glutamate capsule biosynthesis protein CapA/YwtB (metallophosphatase superfamily)